MIDQKVIGEDMFQFGMGIKAKKMFYLIDPAMRIIWKNIYIDSGKLRILNEHNFC